MKKLPNMITMFRIMLSLLLPFSKNHLLGFLILYILCGFSDVLDGILARRLKATSRFGAFLDSVADIIFLGMSIIVVLLNKFYWSSFLLTSIFIILILRIFNIAYTRYKFKQWGIIHTFLNKLMGLILFLIIPIAYIYGEIPDVIILMIGLFGILSTLDESIILFQSKVYDVNKKSFFM